MVKQKKEEVERVIIKLPKSVAKYFRDTFPHGRRSDFIVQCILNYKKAREIEKIENDLRRAIKKRQ